MQYYVIFVIVQLSVSENQKSLQRRDNRVLFSLRGQLLETAPGATVPLIGHRVGDADDLQESAPQSRRTPLCDVRRPGL